jgi:hypothetical protein
MEKPALHPTGVVPVALAVAASSAFPPLFPPVILTREMLAASYRKLPYDPERLTDGGVFDNLGFQKLARLYSREHFHIDYLIVCDAGATFDWDIKTRFSWVISRTARSTDILMRRVARATLSMISSDTIQAEIIHVPISDIVLRSTGDEVVMPIDLQKRLSEVRTDLDKFPRLERDLLLDHGYEVSRDRLRKIPNLTSSIKTADEKAKERQTAGRPNIASAVRTLDESRTRSTGLSRFSDWVSYGLSGRPNIASAVRTLDKSKTRSTGLFRFSDWVSYGLVGWCIALLMLASLPLRYQQAELKSFERRAIESVETLARPSLFLVEVARQTPDGSKQLLKGTAFAVLSDDSLATTFAFTAADLVDDYNGKEITLVEETGDRYRDVKVVASRDGMAVLGMSYGPLPALKLGKPRPQDGGDVLLISLNSDNHVTSTTGRLMSGDEFETRDILGLPKGAPIMSAKGYVVGICRVWGIFTPAFVAAEVLNDYLKDRGRPTLELEIPPERP